MTQKQFRTLRPSRNIVLIMMWFALGSVSTAQLIHGVSPDSVNSSLDSTVQRTLAVTIITVSLLNMLAAWVRHSGISLGIEIGAMLFGASGFLVYAGIIWETNPKPWATVSFGWAVSLLVGCVSRAIQIFRRGY